MPVGRTIHNEIHKLITSIWNKQNCLNSGQSQILYLFIRRVVKLIVVIIQVHHLCCLEVGLGGGGAWTGLIWLRVGTGGSPCECGTELSFHKMWGI